ncbi:hypothetical protein Cgig2_019261 [Carnegiea gigantea]|uniref:DUF4283 domain-containing protein n=1 Tax=Carnegiea gigantea TaxID=171969 RepID=A0A9Q1QKU5_9CARY|nr:hypothetical protein Cgig2_019261 [Carnegiea gigantea]
MKSVFRNVWEPSEGLVIHDLDVNLFSFQFFRVADKEYVLNEGPWAFDGHTLLLKLMTGLEILSEVQFTKARFWVKAYDVLAKKLGRTLKGCKIVDAKEDDPGLQYGAWLKASPLKNRRRNAESELNAERELCLPPLQVCTKLLFTDPAFEKTGEPSKPPENTASASMLTDEDSPIVLGSEAFKRKQDDVPPLKQEWSLLYPGAHVTHIDSDLSDHVPILLKCTSSGDDSYRRTRRFHFENMWLTDPSCKDVINSA